MSTKDLLPQQEADARLVTQGVADPDQQWPAEILDLIAKLTQNEAINDRVFRQFIHTFLYLDEDTQHDVVQKMYDLACDIMDSYQPEMNRLIEALLTDKPVSEDMINLDPGHYYPLLHCVALFQQFRFIEHNKPGAIPGMQDKIRYDVPFAINALILAGVVPSGQKYHGLALDHPFYPIPLNAESSSALPRKEKNYREAYFPLKRDAAKKDTNALIVVNKSKKKTLVAQDGRYSARVMAFKIALLVSERHFVSENRLDNSLSDSQILSKSHTLMKKGRESVDETRNITQQNELKNAERIVPGTGIIDEVTNFVAQLDKDARDYRFSSSNTDTCYLYRATSFDCSSFTHQMDEQYYEQDVLSKNLYDPNMHAVNKQEYQNEKFRARLKLAILSEDVITAVADKAYLHDNNAAREKKEAIGEACRRTDIALSRFLSNPEAKKYIEDNPEVLDEVKGEVKQYIVKHFDKDHEALKDSIDRRAEQVSGAIQARISTDNAQFSDKNRQAYEHLANSSSGNLVDKAKKILADYASGTRFFSGHFNRHYSKQVKEILKKQYASKDELIRDLEQIQADAGEQFNEQGSFARRLAFIKQM